MNLQEIELMQCPFHPKYQAKQKPRCDCKRCWEIWDLKTEWALRHRIEPFGEDDETEYAEFKERQIERQKQRREQNRQSDTDDSFK